jgi:hypothetical protein
MGWGGQEGEGMPVGEEDIAGVDMVVVWMGNAVVCVLGGLLRRGWRRVFGAHKVCMGRLL